MSCGPTSRVVVVPTASDMEALGRRLAGGLQAGDLVILEGELGAGKTVLARGIGAGLGVVGQVVSPTFVLCRVHDSPVGGPGLVHVDAYRLADRSEVDDLDLEALMGDAVTVVEWGRGLVEQLAAERLDVLIERSADPDDDTRRVTLTVVGGLRGRAWLDLAEVGE